MNLQKQLIFEKYGIEEAVYEYVMQREKDLLSLLKKEEEIRDYNQLKVLDAMKDCKLSATHFVDSTGYGYGDIGRDKTEEIFAHYFKAEDALVRTNIVSGTHAIYLGLSGLLRHGDLMVSIAGPLYDTMQNVVGIIGDSDASLLKNGIKYHQVDLKENEFDLDGIKEAMTLNPKILMIQRSTGYSSRPAISIEKMEAVIHFIREIDSKVIILIDNCYGEMTEEKEPIEIGADVICGSLIKNMGAGITLSGGYLCGKKEYIHLISERLTAPGLGKELGISYGSTRTTLQGLYFASSVVCEAKKTARLFTKCFSDLGFPSFPSWDEHRSDIVASIELRNEARVVEFCRAIQSVSAVDSFVVPVPWDMPGYEDQVVMASGSFIDGSSIELSADAPIRPPYMVYFQGGLTIAQGRLAVMKAIQNLKEKNLIDFL